MSFFCILVSWSKTCFLYDNVRINIAMAGLFCFMKTTLHSPLAKSGSWGCLPSTPSHFQWPFRFISSNQHPQMASCSTGRALHSRTSPLHHSLYPSDLTSALFMFQQLGMDESALGEISRASIYGAAMICQALGHI